MTAPANPRDMSAAEVVADIESQLALARRVSNHAHVGSIMSVAAGYPNTEPLILLRPTHARLLSEHVFGGKPANPLSRCVYYKGAKVLEAKVDRPLVVLMPVPPTSTPAWIDKLTASCVNLSVSGLVTS